MRMSVLVVMICMALVALLSGCGGYVSPGGGGEMYRTASVGGTEYASLEEIYRHTKNHASPGEESIWIGLREVEHAAGNR